MSWSHGGLLIFLKVNLQNKVHTADRAGFSNYELLDTERILRKRK